MEKNCKSLDDDNEKRNLCWSSFSCSALFTLLRLPLPHSPFLCLPSPCSSFPRSALAPLAFAIWAWRSCGFGGPVGLEALQAWRPGRPVTTTYHLNYYPFGWIRKLFQPFFLLFNFFAYDTFFLKIHTGQTDCPLQFFFRPKCVEMSKLPWV